MIRFSREPAVSELPTSFPNPFDRHRVHPLAQQAAAEVMACLQSGAADRWQLNTSGGGKMFGVLVVATLDGAVGYLRAFSGTLGGAWLVDGWAPPAFDVAERTAAWGPGEVSLQALIGECDLARGREDNLQAQHDRIAIEHQVARDALRTTHQERRRIRRDTRESEPGQQALHTLDQESRRDKAERRTLDAQQAQVLDPVDDALRRANQHTCELETRRAQLSAALLQQIQDSYRFADASGIERSLAELFAPSEPPGGAGDCAGPKLLAAAYRDGLRPLALAEFWWGTPPRTVDRHPGVFYPSCRGKCAPILAHMLNGLPLEAPALFGDSPPNRDVLDIVYEDDTLVIVDKPSGLLSVPGRNDALRDSVLTRLRARYPGATGPLLAHRLDLDTSGLLVAAKDLATFVAMQHLFARRAVHKSYTAMVRGAPQGAHGVIDLSLRPDVDDRPRQIHDPVVGKAAITHWRVLSRDHRYTRIALEPVTGRTHQLRVHAAHPLGLDAPIVGDRLYGRVLPDADQRLMLHATALEFTHPHTGLRVMIERPATF